jgi:hypothetical protein
VSFRAFCAEPQNPSEFKFIQLDFQIFSIDMYRLVMISVVCECKRDQDHATGVLKNSHLIKCPTSDTSKKASTKTSYE